jgi:hypothetical protein
VRRLLIRSNEANVKVRRIIGLGIAALFAAGFAAAQQPQEGWHANGTLGFGYYHTVQTTFLPEPVTGPESTYDTIFGDVRLDLNGYFKDPRLLPFSVNFDTLQGSNDVDVNSYGSSLYNWGFNTTFLPVRSFPLRVYYQKSQFSASGDVFGQNADTSNLGVNWTLRETTLPKINLDFSRYENKIRLATSLFDTNYDQNHFAAGVEDQWRGWGWATSFEHYQNSSNFANFETLPTNYHENLNLLDVRVHRAFWEDKAKFDVDNRSEWRHDELPTVGTSDSSDSYTSATLNIRHTRKLSTSYFYNFAHVTTGTALLPDGSIAPGQVTFFLAPSFNSDYAGARADYQLTNHVRVFQEIRYQYATPPSSQVEYQQSLTETLSGLGYQTSWRKIDLDASYIGHFQILGTNFGNHQNSFSNDFYGRVAWGNVRRVRLSASGDYSKLNLVQQLNGFSEDRRIRLEAETQRWNSFLFRAFVERSYIELLNLAGDITQNTTGFGFQVEHPRFSLSASHMIQDGAGALFPATIQEQQIISAPLPINLLLGSPLLNRNAYTNAAALILRLHRNLDLDAHYRDEKDLLTASRFTFAEEEVRLRYRLGKIELDAGYGHFRNESFTQPNNSGLRTNRVLFRIARDFKVF